MTSKVLITEPYFYNRSYISCETRYLADKRKDTDLKLIKVDKTINEYDFSESDYESDRESGWSNKFGIKGKYKKNKRRFVATLFGRRTDDSRSIAIHILRYRPRVYVEVPRQFWTDKESCYNFRNVLNRYLMEKVSYKHRCPSLISLCSLVRRKTIYGFTNGEKRIMICYSFKNSNTRSKYCWIIERTRLIIGNDSRFKLLLCKDGVPDNEKLTLYMKYDSQNTKFFQDINLRPFGILDVGKKFINIPRDDKVTICDYEISMTYDDLRKCNKTAITEKERLRLRSTTNLVKFAFDIETYAHISKPEKLVKLKEQYNEENYRRIKERLFVHPVLKNGDQIVSICISILIGPCYGITGEWKNICLAIDDHDQDYIDQINKKEKVNMVVIRCKSEKDMLLKFIDLHRQYCPDISYTYNGLGYDINYVKVRCEWYDIYMSHFTRMSKLRDMKCKWIEMDRNVKMSFGKVKCMRTPGTLNVDLQVFYMTKNDSKLSDLKLKTITGEYLDIKYAKKDLPYKTMYKYIENSREGKMGCEVGISKVCEYNMYDCICLHHLSYSCSVISEYSEGSNVHWLGIYDYVNSGMNRKIISIISYVAEGQGFLIPHSKYDIKTILDECTEEEYDKYCELIEEKDQLKFIKDIYGKNRPKGGKVFLPKGETYELVSTLDVKSMYPNEIKGDNISPDRIVLNKRYLDLPGVDYITFPWTTKNGRMRMATYADSKANRTEIGIYPQVVDILLNQRSKIKKEMKEMTKLYLKEGKIKTEKEISKFTEWKVLNSRQLTVKVACNSVYGNTICRWSPLYIKALGGSITQKAREYITMCAHAVAWRFKANIVYGDTDSIFVKFPKKFDDHRKEFERVWDLSMAATKYLNDISREHLLSYRMEMEKVFIKITFLEGIKKTYFGLMTEKKDMSEIKPKMMGIKTKRRDASKIEKYIGHGIMNRVNEGDFDKIIDFLKKTIDEVFTGSFTNNYFLKSGKFRGIEAYKRPDSLPQCRAVKIIEKLDPGNRPMAGERVFYTFKKVKVVRGPRGGLRFPRRADQVWPLDYLGKNDKIDYRVFVEYGLRTYSKLLEPIIQKKYGVDYITYFRKYMSQYEDMFTD